jgi:hypothetical protein
MSSGMSSGGEFQGQCGLARPRDLAGVNPAWVIVSHEPSIQPCGVDGNGHEKRGLSLMCPH